MENNKLISMVQFTLQLAESKEVKLSKLVNYAKFLSQPLTLSMFVPCDDEGNVIEEPKPEDYFPVDKPVNEFTEADGQGLSDYYSPMMRYEDARLKVLFEGFEVIGCDDDGVEIEMTDNNIWITALSTGINITHYDGYDGQEREIKTVEEMFEFLKEYGLQATLSATALKQIYG